MSAPVFDGGGLCGAIRYRAAGEPANPSHCHCQDCRRSSGAPFVSWATFRAGDFAFTRGSPQQYAYDGRVRSFCGRCGTPLTFQAAEWPDEIDVTLGSLDQAERVTPRDHIWGSDRLPWITMADGLPLFAGRRTASTETQGSSS